MIYIKNRLGEKAGQSVSDISMNTWVFLLLATSSTTNVKGNDYEGSEASPGVIRKEYSSGSQVQITGESSPRTIFLYPPSGGSNGESRSGHHNRPGILHSRYLASPQEGESSKTSQLNTLPPQSQGRHQEHNDNDSHMDSRYHGSSSASVFVNNNHPLDSHDQLAGGSVPRASYVHAPQDRSREEPRDEQRDSLNYHSSRSNPSDHNSFSQHSSDQSFGESSPHVTFVLPPHAHGGGNHENSISEKREDLKYPNSREFPSLVHKKFSPAPRDQSFDDSDQRPHHDHLAHGRSHEETHEGQQINLKYYNPTSNPSVPNHHGFQSNHHDHQFDKSSSMANYEPQKENPRYHNPSINHPAVFHSEISPNTLHQLHDRSTPRVKVNHPSFDSNYEPTHDGEHEHSKYQSPQTNPPLASHNDISSNHHDPSSSEFSISNSKFPNHPYEETHEKDYKNNPSALKYLTPASNPSVVFQSGYSSNTHVQASDEVDRQSIFHPPQRESQSELSYQADSKYIDRSSLSSIKHNNESPSKTNDQSSDESFHHSVFIQPPQNKNYWKNHNGRQEDLRYVSSPRNPPTATHDLSNPQINPFQNIHHFDLTPRQPFGENIKTSHGFGQKPTISPPTVIHNRYVESPNEGTEIKNRYPLSQGQISYGESSNSNNNKPFEQFSYEDHNVSPQQVPKDSFVETYPKTQDHVRYHQGDSSSNKYLSEHNEMHTGQNQGYESRVPVHSPTSHPESEHKIHASNHHNNHPIMNQPLLNHQQSDYYNRHHAPEHSGHSEDRREVSGYIPYSGPYTRPQVLHDRPITQEIATVTVEPFGTAKAQPPRDLQPNSYLNSHYSAGPRKPDVQHIQVHGNQHGETVHEHDNARNIGFSESRYTQFSPPTVYDDPSPNQQGQFRKPNIRESPVTYRPQTYAGSIREGSYGDHYSSEQNRIPETYKETPHQHSGPSSPSQHQQDIFNAYIPYNSTRNEQFGTAARFQTNPPYAYGGEYVNHPGSNSNSYHSENQHELSPHVPLRNANIIPQDVYDRHNSTKSNNFPPINPPLTQTTYSNGGSYSDSFSSGSVGHSGAHQDLHVHQVPVSNSQMGYNNTNSEYLNTAPIPLNSGSYLDGNDHIYSLGKDTRVQQAYTSQDHNNHQLRQNLPPSNSPEVAPNRVEHFNHAGNIQPNAGQQDGSIHTQSYPSTDHLYPGIHHEYALKFSFNKPKPIAQALPLIPNFNQSAHFTVTPAPQIYAGHLDSGSQHPSGPVRYIDTQYGYAPHMPYHTVPVVKPIVMQSGYQEDTHEISHAKHDHLHVHHSSQSGYQYGIIN